LNAAVNDMESKAVLLRDEPMAKHTSWRVGGPADIFVKPTSMPALISFLQALPPSTPLYWVGLGSNLLVRDGGLRGAVVCTSALPRDLERLDALRVRAAAGVPCTSLARRCVRWQLGPAAFFAGIPGTVGGALAMNAGAFEGETWDRVESVETIDRQGHVRVRGRDEFKVSYRSVAGPPGQWFVAATFEFEADPNTPVSAIKAMVTKRGELQPLDRPSAGSVFRNPDEAPAGRLIERAGLKGMRIGGAMVSEKHANFIVNVGRATAADIESLIEHVQREVRRQFGVELQTEVRVIGEPEGGQG